MIWDSSILGCKCTFRNNLLKVLTFSSSTPWLLIAHHNKIAIVCHSVTNIDLQVKIVRSPVRLYAGFFFLPISVSIFNPFYGQINLQWEMSAIWALINGFTENYFI